MKRKWFKTAAAVCAAFLCLCGCSGNLADEAAKDAESKTMDTETAAEAKEGEGEPKSVPKLQTEIEDMKLSDKDLLYASDDETSVVTMYLTVRRGNEAEGTDHSWEEINTYSAYDYDAMGIKRYQTEAILQVGDENGPLPGELGWEVQVPNATVQIRGQTSSRNAQKNYKIRLKDNKGLWRGQQTINLNKHQTDGMRFRNKLGFDLIKGIPQMMSLRTQFVHLYVKDETNGPAEAFEDYGLFTQVEQLNKKGLRAHGLDINAHLYKINACEFYRYEDAVRTVDDPAFDEAAFEKILECKGNNDHTKLIRLLEDINDYSVSVDELIEKHFDVENIVYWMAFHILTGNVDTQNRNFYIYSPQNSEKWYIISWDLDAAFKKAERGIQGRIDGEEWESGVSNYWGNMMFRRLLKSDAFRARLDEAILDVKDYLSKERLDDMIREYRKVTEAYIWSMPDRLHEPLTPEEYDRVAKAIPQEVEICYERYQKSLQNPLPFFIGVPEKADGQLVINWDAAYDFQAEDITYTAEVSDRYDMTNVIASYEGIWPEMKMDQLPEGQYFIRVKARDSSGHEQYAFDCYITERGKEYGIKCFYVLADGTIAEDIYEE